MNRIILIVLIWLKSSLLFSQIANVKIDYSVIIEKDEILEKSVLERGESNFGNQLYLEALQDYENYGFTLVKNDSITAFYISEYQGKFTDKTDDFIMAGYSGVIYQVNDICYKYIPSENLFGYSKLYNEWEITTESKLIDGYKCYKAKGIKRVETKNYLFNHQMVAWFCPDLPYSIGPMGYGSLPGLILEIKIRNATFFATKIEINTKEKVDVAFFNKFKKITMEEFNTKIENEMEEATKRMNRRN
jgi:GLPGLI family protein